MHKRSKFLDKWEDFCPFGDVIEKTCILPLKVPLKESLSKRYEEKERFTPQTLIDMLNDRGLTLGLIIDLTFTTKYYNPEEFTQKGINYEKIYVAGQKIPSDEAVYQMFDIINSFQQHVNVDNKYIIGIHCTHGINRTGYMICRYLMDVLGWQSGEAVDAFNKARHHQIYRENFVKELHRRGKLQESEMKVGPPRGGFKREGWSKDPGGFSAGFNFVHPVPSFSCKSGDSSGSHTIVPVKELTSNSDNDLKYASGLDCPEHVVEGTIMKLMTKKENHDFPLTSVRKCCPLEVTSCESQMKVGPPRGRFKREGWRQDPGGFSAGFNFVRPVPSFSFKSGDTHTIVPVKELTSNSKNDLKYAAGFDCPEHVVEGTIMNVMTKKENHDSPLTSVRKCCPLAVTGVIEVKGPDDKNPQYTDLVSLPEDQVVLIDSNNNRCFLLDSSFNNIYSYPLSNKPRRVSLFDGNEVAVTLNNKNQIQFLTVKNNTIKPTRMIKTRLPCFGIAVAGKGSTIVTGPNFARSKCYWSVINDRGEEMSYHEYWDSALNDSYLALNASKTRVYISTWETNSLFCFDIAGRRLFVYSPDNLKGSYGITLDMDDNVYVVGKQSKNIHQLSPDGAVLQILTAELPQYPAAVTYKRTKNQLLLTNRSSDNKKIHVIKLS